MNNAVHQTDREAGFNIRYLAWMSQVADWADFHGITRAQAMSILGEFKADVVSYRSLFEWVEVQEFISRYVDGPP